MMEVRRSAQDFIVKYVKYVDNKYTEKKIFNIRQRNHMEELL